VPGWNIDSQIEDIDQQQSISINIKLFQKLQCLADS